MKKRFKFFSIGLALSSIVSCSNKSYLSAVIKNPEKVKHLTSVHQYHSDQKYLDFIQKVKEFSVKLSSAFAKYQIKENKTNFSCSPLSAFLCLGLGVTSSSGDTQKEILDAFNLDYDTFKKYYNVYFDDLIIRASNRENKSSLSLSNSVWLDKECKTIDSGLEELKNDNYCYSFHADFKNQNKKANEQVREFIKDKTNGLIDRDFGFDTDTLFLLINTLYLIDSWNESSSDLPYASNSGEEYVFTNSDGSKSDKKLLQGYYFDGKPQVSETYTSFFTYTNNFKIYFMVPNEGNKINDIFTTDNISQVIDTSKYVYEDKELNIEYSTRVLFPEFEVGTQSLLDDILKEEFNINTMFSLDCDFSKITKDSTVVSKVIHDTKLIVNKEGIEGGAVTIINVAETSSGPRETEYADFLVNKEFGFILTSNDSIIFSGIINNIDKK